MQNPFSKKKKILSNLDQTRKAKTQVVKKDLAIDDNETTAFIKCPACHQTLLLDDLFESLHVCPKCAEHLQLPSNRRLDAVFDKAKYKTIETTNTLSDPLKFPEYTEKCQNLADEIALDDAVLAGIGKIGGNLAVVVCLDSRFLMGSMGVIVGETVTLAAELAESKKIPLIIFSASGGARMQEGIFSLMQMAKTSAAIERFSKNGGLFISYLTHPTTGGVSASFANLGDIIIAEPHALIGFAGPRVIKETIKQELPEGFQRAEYLMKHGFIDQIISREAMRSTLIQLIKLHGKEQSNVKRLRAKN